MTIKNKSKADADKLEQVKRIMKLLQKRGQNNEMINDVYRELLNCKEDGVN